MRRAWLTVALALIGVSFALLAPVWAEEVVEAWRSPFGSVLSVSAHAVDGSCWVAEYGRGQVVHLSATGQELWRGGDVADPMEHSARPRPLP